MRNGYFEHLCEMVNIDGKNGRPYTHLARRLHSVEFDSHVPGDINRADDGVALRDGYSDSPDGKCTVFEMLVALSQEMEYFIGGMIQEDTMDIWFHQMLENLGISTLDDAFWERNPADAKDICDDAVGLWLNRDYEFDGTGGLFPLKNPTFDQAKVEIWYQMNAYLREILDENEHPGH